MKKIIAKKTYNTETAQLIKHVTCGEFGETNGYEEILFQTKKGDFFLYGLGGVDSPYSTETIIPLTKTEAKEWENTNK